jgi:5-methylcytosine-specific restriction endonuclease McrA
MVIRLCLEPGCPNEATHRGRCHLHAKQAGYRARLRKPRYDVYGSKRWRALRKRVLFEEPLCRVCGRAADHVDHIIPLDRGGEPFARANTQPLCRSCHGKKSRADDQGRVATGEAVKR